MVSDFAFCVQYRGWMILGKNEIKKERQMALDRSPEFCFYNFWYMYIWEAGNVRWKRIFSIDQVLFM